MVGRQPWRCQGFLKIPGVSNHGYPNILVILVKLIWIVLLPYSPENTGEVCHSNNGHPWDAHQWSISGLNTWYYQDNGKHIPDIICLASHSIIPFTPRYSKRLTNYPLGDRDASWNTGFAMGITQARNFFTFLSNHIAPERQYKRHRYSTTESVIGSDGYSDRHRCGHANRGIR